MRKRLAAPTMTRVERNTAERINAWIRGRALDRMAKMRHATNGELERRIHELQREWDVERTLEAGGAGFAILGLALGAAVDRKWYALPAVVAAFLLEHAVQGWSPPLAALRRLGVRTAHEIERERRGLEEICRERSPRQRRAVEHYYGLPD